MCLSVFSCFSFFVTWSLFGAKLAAMSQTLLRCRSCTEQCSKWCVHSSCRPCCKRITHETGQACPGHAQEYVRGPRVCRGGLGKKNERLQAHRAFCLKFRPQIERATQKYAVSANLSPDVVALLWADDVMTDLCLQRVVNQIPLRDQEQLEQEHGIEHVVEFPASASQQD